jgi:hypothetical protein
LKKKFFRNSSADDEINMIPINEITVSENNTNDSTLNNGNGIFEFDVNFKIKKN